jgi:hypothetical protein
VNGGAGGTYSFAIDEGDAAIDGTALAVVYTLASLPTATVALLDGFSATTGDTATLDFAAPLDPGAPGFFAEMRLGIGFSCCGDQYSEVAVNGTTITRNAGNFDDGDVLGNGALITVGGSNDPFSPLLPEYAEDHERYDLAPYVAAGTTRITVDTFNPSGDDNIFFAGFYASGQARVNQPAPSVPEPASWALMLGGFGATGAVIRRRQGRRLAAA